MNRNSRQIFALTLLMAVAVSYQNCSPEIPQKEGTGSNSSSTAAPFAYSTTVDRIAYMSCNPINNPNHDDYFTFRVHAKDTTSSGVTLTQQFRDFSAGSTPAQKVSLMNSSESNNGARIQLAVRPANAMAESVISPNGQILFQNILPVLSETGIAFDLASLSPGQFLPSSKYNLKGSLQFGNANADAFRADFTTAKNLLALTYTTTKSQYAARTVNGETVGTSYFLKFNCLPAPKTYVLCGIDELDIRRMSNTGANWDCPQELQFRIVRMEHASAQGCNFATPPTSSPYYLFYQEARNILGPGWQIDAQNRCIARNSDLCYGTSDVDYNNSSTCDQPGYPACTRHLSLCLKDT